MKIVFEDADNRRNFKSCDDICKSGISRFAPAPILNHWRHISTKEIEDTDTDYVIVSGVNHSPEDWTGHKPYSRVKSLFSYLSPKYLNDLRNNKAILLLDQSLEGYHRTWIFDFFHGECNHYHINPSNIVYTTGNMLVQEDYARWLVENPQDNKLNVFPYAHFEKDMYNLSRSTQLDSLTKTNLKYKKENNIKLYNCLNKRDRNHRAWFYTKLYQAGLLDDGLIAMNNFTNGHTMSGESIDPETIRKVNETLPRWIDEPNNLHDDNYYIRRIRFDVCLDSYLTVVSEASFADENNTLFLSEKTFKAIASRHPFIILGDKGSLKKLRELGYKTFEGFIDESYDELPTHERMDAIIDALKKLKQENNMHKWYKRLQPTLNYNYNRLKNRSIRKNKTVADIELLYSKKFGADNV
jgi:hypothetical protein